VIAFCVSERWPNGGKTASKRTLLPITILLTVRLQECQLRQVELFYSLQMKKQIFRQLKTICEKRLMILRQRNL